uniref:Peptidase S1 domain-containing protein n=1 Tax=Romanomermis culicivorax TaxID=13658 RepID=A0A915HU47_ROMCU
MIPEELMETRSLVAFYPDHPIAVIRNLISPTDCTLLCFYHDQCISANIDEYNYRPKVAQIIRSMSVYSPLQPGAVEKASTQKSQQPATMGTFIGVFLPCVQNIFGVLFFIRLGWIVGTAGLISSLFIVLICCLVLAVELVKKRQTKPLIFVVLHTQVLTTFGFKSKLDQFIISIKTQCEISTYYSFAIDFVTIQMTIQELKLVTELDIPEKCIVPMRSGTDLIVVKVQFSCSLTHTHKTYRESAAEIFLLYLVPRAKIFDEMTHCYRLYGTIVLILTALIVVAGVKVVNKFALPTVVVVNLCIVLSFVGMFVNISGTERLKWVDASRLWRHFSDAAFIFSRYCMVGDRLADLNSWLDVNRSDRLECTPEQLRKMFCKTKSDSSCDPYFLAMKAAGRIGPKQAILGLTSGVIKDDIAVVEFDTKIYFNDYVRPICLPPDFEHWTSRHRDFQSCLTCGWGIVNSITRRGANSLNCIEVPIYTSKFKGDRLTYKMSHVKWQGAMKGSYLGDSGSPYVCRFSLDEPFLVYGITSGVIEPKIDRPYSYNVFIVVHLYLKWILDTIKSLEEDKPNRPPTLAEKLKTLCSSFKFSGCYRVHPPIFL